MKGRSKIAWDELFKGLEMDESIWVEAARRCWKLPTWVCNVTSLLDFNLYLSGSSCFLCCEHVIKRIRV